MNIEALNSQIDQFFNSISPNDVVALFKEIGYEFDYKVPYKEKNIIVRREAHKTQLNLLGIHRHYVDVPIVDSLSSMQEVRCSFLSAKTDTLKSEIQIDYSDTDFFTNYVVAA